MRLGTIFYNDFELLDVYGPLEMFGALGDKIELVTIAEQAGPVKSSPGPKTPRTTVLTMRRNWT